MLTCQKALFSLDPGIHYLNCAYMSPLLKSVEQAGIEGLIKKRNPYRVTPIDFFTEAIEVRNLFGRLVNADPERIAVIPSVSYGMGVVIQNLNTSAGQKVVTVHEEFPSDVYALHRICREHGLELVTVHPPDELQQRGKNWNTRLLEAITADTALVNLSSVHWADGTVFDLEAVGRRAKEVGALFVVDGTQSVGAMDFDVKKYRVDALICAGYKWLLGPYNSGLAYFGEYFDNGVPLEESWLNRMDSENFRGLVNYQPEYRPMAARYNVGEYGNFISLPMLNAALRQILDWTPAGIQHYCRHLSQPLVSYLSANGYWIEEAEARTGHLFGFRLPEHLSVDELQQKFAERNVMVSLRGNAVRVAPHLYNDEADVAALLAALQSVKN